MPEGSPTKGADRVSRHRRKLRRAGARRVELVATEEDAHLIREVAATLRSEGLEGRRLRAALHDLVRRPQARTGADLVAFFRASPLVGEDIEIERDRSPGRSADLA